MKQKRAKKTKAKKSKAASSLESALLKMKNAPGGMAKVSPSPMQKVLAKKKF